MIKEILILLWILIIPLLVSIRQLYLKIDRKKWEELGSSNEYARIFVMILGSLLLLAVPIFCFPEDFTKEFAYMLSGVVISIDIIIFLTYCLSEYHNISKKIITCLFVLFNCTTSVLWILNTVLSNKSIAIGIYLYCLSGFIYIVLYDRRKIK